METTYGVGLLNSFFKLTIVSYEFCLVIENDLKGVKQQIYLKD